MEDKIYEAFKILSGLKEEVENGETKYQEMIDVFEPIVKYAFKMSIIDKFVND